MSVIFPASNALIRSLNIPAVLQLSNYGQHRFYDKLKELELYSLSNNAEHYGLSLILGGAEASMWELGSIYKGMASTLNDFEENTQQFTRVPLLPLERSYFKLTTFPLIVLV